MAIIHLLPKLVAERDGKARYLCPGCHKISDWLTRPTEPFGDSVCICGRMLEKLPKIIDLRKSDGKAIYECDKCQHSTSYVKMPDEPGGMVQHGCDTSSFAMPDGQFKPPDAAVQASPCAAGKISSSEMLLVTAVKQIGTRSPKLTKFITEQLLPKYMEMRKLVAEDDVKAALEK